MKQYLLIDIGGTFIKYSLADEQARKISGGKVPTPLTNMDDLLAAIEGFAAPLQGQFVGCAISMPGRIDTRNGIAHTGGMLSAFMWEQPFAAQVEARLGVPVTIANDGKCAAAAEGWTGALAGVENGLVLALGTGIGDEFDISKVRYHKIFIMADADVDGSHICTLMLTFFFRYMRPLIDHGYVYVAQPPLFKLQKGQTVKYAYNDDEMKMLSAEMPGAKVNRYKGLGEMNPDQLWETTMNPDNRVIVQIKIEDAERADEAFSILMGEQVEPRRQFIEKNAKIGRAHV